MKTTKKVYISLGSNKGEKFKNLQEAINAIYQKIGNIKIISKVYKSASFGFKGDDFLNVCAIIETSLSASNVLKELLKIEKSLGRIRSKTSGYEDRIIDLDIVFMKKISLTQNHSKFHTLNYINENLYYNP